jgi:hypothetical protein
MGGIERTCHQLSSRSTTRGSLHDVMVVSGQDGDTSPRLPIPNPDSLIIRSRDDPRVLSVEKDSSNIVEICHQLHITQPEKRLTTSQGE